MDKKKIGILAILLFLIIGLGTFVFANPDNQENFKDSEPNAGEEVDSEADGDKDTSEEENNGASDSETLLSEEADSQNTQARNTVNTSGNTQNNNSNNNSGSSNNGGNSTETKDYYAEALKAVIDAETSLNQGDVNYASDLVDKVTNPSQKEELNNRLEEVQKIIDVTALVDRLEKMVANSENRNDIIDSIDYRDEEKIEELVND